MKDGKKYILVADDDREIREIVGLLLSSEGYAVLTAEDGIQAARLASGEIDLYLLDVNMPGQSGTSNSSFTLLLAASKAASAANSRYPPALAESATDSPSSSWRAYMILCLSEQLREARQNTSHACLAIYSSADGTEGDDMTNRSGCIEKSMYNLRLARRLLHIVQVLFRNAP